MSNLNVKSAIASATVDALASVCGQIVSSEAFKAVEQQTSKEEIQGAMASAVIAGIVRFCAKTFAIAGFSENELVEAIRISYKASQEDPDVKTANSFRKAKDDMGSSYKGTLQ